MDLAVRQMTRPNCSAGSRRGQVVGNRSASQINDLGGESLVCATARPARPYLALAGNPTSAYIKQASLTMKTPSMSSCSSVSSGAGQNVTGGQPGECLVRRRVDLRREVAGTSTTSDSLFGGTLRESRRPLSSKAAQQRRRWVDEEEDQGQTFADTT